MTSVLIHHRLSRRGVLHPTFGCERVERPTVQVFIKLKSVPPDDISFLIKDIPEGGISQHVPSEDVVSESAIRFGPMNRRLFWPTGDWQLGLVPDHARAPC